MKIFPNLTAMALCVGLCAPLLAATTNPNATPETKALLAYFVSISGLKILSGQESMFGDGAFPSTRDQYVQQITSKYPAIYNSDFGDVNTGNLSDRKKVVSNALAYHKQGSVIAFQYHMIQPDLVDGAGFAAMNIPGSGYTKLNEILTAGSALNTEFNKRLDELAGYFHTLQDSGVPILWRPYHEMNGDFFWWSHQERYKDLWKYTYEYLTTTKQCNNLIWVFGVNYFPNGATGKNSPTYYYPGHAYVDMLSCDFYTESGHSYAKHVHDDLRALGGNRPIAIGENGPMPDIPVLREQQPYWVYWCTWWGFEGANKGNTDALYAKNYNDPAVITQDEVMVAPVDTNQRVVRVATEGSGTVTRSPNTQTVLKGTSVTFTANPLNGWDFKGWTGSSTSVINPLILTVNEYVDLTATFTPKAGTLVNLVQNGEFAVDAASWSLAGYGGGAASGSVQNGVYGVAISLGGTEAWHIQVIQPALKLEMGKTYTLSFDAHAAASKPIFVKLGRASGDYKEYIGMSLTLGTVSMNYKKTFTMSDTTDPGARLEFNIGGNTSAFSLDNVSLMEGTGNISVKRKFAGPVGATPEFFRTKDGLGYALPTGFHRMTLYRPGGKAMATYQGALGFISHDRLPPGLYLVRMSGKNGSGNATLLVER